MSRSPFHVKIAASITTVLALLLALFCNSASAQAPKSTASLGSIEQELIKTETGFFEAWKMKDEGYFRAHIAENGVFWGEYGTFSRDEQLQEQREAAKVCNVQGYGLSDFGVMPLTAGVYLLTYKADQYATCNGEKVPVHMNGSSVYVLRAGHWQAVYRAEVPLQNQH